LLTFEAQQRAFVQRKFHEELQDVGIEDAEGLRFVLRAVLQNPRCVAHRQWIRNLAQRFHEEFMVAIAELDGVEPLDWWRSARWALERCGMRVRREDVLVGASPDRRQALAKHIALASRHAGGGVCYATTNLLSPDPDDDPNHGPLVIDRWTTDSPTIGVFLGTEFVPAEPVHVLDALLIPIRAWGSRQPIAAARARVLLVRMAGGVVRQLERQFAEEFLLTWTSDQRDAGQLPS